MSSSPIVDRLLDTGVSDALTDLALDLRWSFNHSADQLWEQLDPELWELTHNPSEAATELTGEWSLAYAHAWNEWCSIPLESAREVSRRISPVAMRIEIVRLMQTRREFISEVAGSRIMIAAPTTFDLLPVSGFAKPDDILEAFDAKLRGIL